MKKKKIILFLLLVISNLAYSQKQKRATQKKDSQPAKNRSLVTGSIQSQEDSLKIVLQEYIRLNKKLLNNNSGAWIY
jgi:hypothetical protein